MQALKDNFPGFSSEQLYTRRIDGKTFYDHVLAGKVLNTEKKGCFKMGCLFYGDLRRKYKDGDDPEVLMAEVKVDETEIVRPRLFKAMVAAMKTIPNRSALVEFLDVEEKPNHHELVGVLKWCLQQHASVSPEQLTPLALEWFCIDLEYINKLEDRAMRGGLFLTNLTGLTPLLAPWRHTSLARAVATGVGAS